jgi:SAM-dependent methyltransferase
MPITRLQQDYPWGTQAVLNYYEANRRKADEIYPSERVFLDDAVKSHSSLLDIGCATGGFSKALRELNPKLQYTGVDITPAMIETAQKQFPEDKFLLIDGQKLPFADDTFDVAICFGVLHMTTNWRELLAEGWRICRKTFLFDLRLTDSEGICDPATSFQKLAFDDEWDGESMAPYIVLNQRDAMNNIQALTPPFGSLQGYGYINQVSGNTVSPYRSVCMAAFCLGKNSENSGITRWDLPFPQP